VEKVSGKYFEEVFEVLPRKNRIKFQIIENRILDIIKLTPDISIPRLAIELDRIPDSIRYYLT
jgi:hypothetical protein